MNISASKTAGIVHDTLSIPGMCLSFIFNFKAFDIATTIAKDPIPKVSAKFATNPMNPGFFQVSSSN